MKTRKIGNLDVSAIGMGCMGFSHGYGQIPERSYSIEAIREAYNAGCTFSILLKLTAMYCIMKDIMRKLSVRPLNRSETRPSSQQSSIFTMRNWQTALICMN